MTRYYQQLYRSFLSGCWLERLQQPWGDTKICLRWENGHSWSEANDQLLERYAVVVRDG